MWLHFAIGGYPIVIGMAVRSPETIRGTAKGSSFLYAIKQTRVVVKPHINIATLLIEVTWQFVINNIVIITIASRIAALKIFLSIIYVIWFVNNKTYKYFCTTSIAHFRQKSIGKIFLTLGERDWKGTQ